MEVWNRGCTDPSTINDDRLLARLTETVWFAWLATKQIGQRFRLSEVASPGFPGRLS